MNPIVACKLGLNCNAPQVPILTKVWAKMVRNFGAYSPTLYCISSYSQICNPRSPRYATPQQHNYLSDTKHKLSNTLAW